MSRTRAQLEQDELASEARHAAQEVRRFADRLEQIAGLTLPATRMRPAGHLPSVRLLRAERRLRGEIIRGCPFADPGWDLLLELYRIQLEGRLATVGELCREIGLSGATSRRWLDRLEDAGLIGRQGDQADLRRVRVTLTDAGSRAMARYFDAIR